MRHLSQQVDPQGVHDRSRDFILDRENIVQCPVPGFGPEVIAVRGLDELRGDADVITGLPDAAL